jgi:hypothetical protein
MLVRDSSNNTVYEDTPKIEAKLKFDHDTRPKEFLYPSYVHSCI